MQNNWPRGTAGRVVWGGRGGTRGLRAGGRCPEAVGETPPTPSGWHNAPRGPGALFPQSICPWARPGGTQAPLPLKASEPPQGSLWGWSWFYSHARDSPHPSRFPTAPQPAAPSPCCSAAPHAGKNKAQPCTNCPLLGVHSRFGEGGGQCERPLGVELRAGLAAVGPRLGAAAGQEDPAGPDLQEQLGHGYGASPPVLRSMGLFGFLWALHALGKC